MKKIVMALLAALVLASASACRNDRNDETGRGEREERLDTVRGERPE